MLKGGVGRIMLFCSSHVLVILVTNGKLLGVDGTSFIYCPYFDFEQGLDVQMEKKDSSSPAFESVLPVNSVSEGLPDSSRLRVALFPAALPALPRTEHRPPPSAGGEPGPGRPSPTGIWGLYQQDKLGRVLSTRRKAAEVDSTSFWFYSKVGPIINPDPGAAELTLDVSSSA